MMVRILALLILGIGTCEGIFNGKEAGENEYPWTAWLRRGNVRVQCGAALIASKYVLTAAQCASGVVNAIILGDHDRTQYTGYEQEYTIANTTIHPGYNKRTLENNLAILELSSTADINGYAVDIIPVLDDSGNTDSILSKNCRVMGWGFRRFSTGWDDADILQELTVNRVNNSYCLNGNDDSMCLQPYRDEHSTLCVADQGNPLVCQKQGAWLLSGVISMSSDEFDSPGGCSRGFRSAVLPHLFKDWIDSVI